MQTAWYHPLLPHILCMWYPYCLPLPYIWPEWCPSFPGKLRHIVTLPWGFFRVNFSLTLNNASLGWDTWCTIICQYLDSISRDIRWSAFPVCITAFSYCWKSNLKGLVFFLGRSRIHRVSTWTLTIIPLLGVVSLLIPLSLPMFLCHNTSYYFSQNITEVLYPLNLEHSLP